MCHNWPRPLERRLRDHETLSETAASSRWCGSPGRRRRVLWAVPSRRSSGLPVGVWLRGCGWGPLGPPEGVRGCPRARWRVPSGCRGFLRGWGLLPKAVAGKSPRAFTARDQSRLKTCPEAVVIAWGRRIGGSASPRPPLTSRFSTGMTQQLACRPEIPFRGMHRGRGAGNTHHGATLLLGSVANHR